MIAGVRMLDILIPIQIWYQDIGFTKLGQVDNAARGVSLNK